MKLEVGSSGRPVKGWHAIHTAPGWLVVLLVSLVCGVSLTVLVGARLIQPCGRAAAAPHPSWRRAGPGGGAPAGGSNASVAAPQQQQQQQQQQQPRKGKAMYSGLSEHPACAFFRSGAARVDDEHHWGPHGLCLDGEPGAWLRRSRSNCYSCLDPSVNVCADPPTMYYHQYLESLHAEAWEANLLSIKVFLMTQDLRRSKMVVWVPRPEQVYDARSAPFFDAFADHVSVQRFDYAEEVRGTAWEGDRFFGNATRVKEHMPKAGSYSDVVRILILHKYGGFWMDNDVVLYQDVSHLLLTSLQFVVRWMNLHVMRMDAGSRLTRRAMQLALELPLDHPEFMSEVVERRCKPHGYYQLVADGYGYTDIYNGCLHRLLLRFNNTGPRDAVLYDLPLGWWDHDWVGCFKSREAINDTRWREVAGAYLAMHNRYPGDLNLGPDGPDPSPLRRVLAVVRDWFAACGDPSCLPPEGLPLLAYEGVRDRPPGARRARSLAAAAEGEGEGEGEERGQGDEGAAARGAVRARAAQMGRQQQQQQQQRWQGLQQSQQRRQRRRRRGETRRRRLLADAGAA